MTAADGARSVRIEITGRVQGVGFRAWAAARARMLGLSGWVRNRADGSVEALFAGPAAAVDTMLADCRRGPPAAVVRGLVTSPAEPPAYPGFAQRPNA